MMFPQASLVDRLAIFIPLVLLWLSSFRAQAQAIAKCWVFSPVVDEASVRAEVSTVSTVEPGTSRQLWSVSSRVTWDRPQTLGSDGAYAVSVLRMPSFQAPQFCTMEENEVLVHTEEHTFTGLDFGFLYEFTVFVLNGTSMAKSLVGVSKGFGTPDCFQATADREFCRGAVVQSAGAPIEPRLESQCQQENSALITARLSWEPPIQLNGHITAYKLQYSEPDAPPGTLPEVVTAMPESTTPEGRVTTDLRNMTLGSSYTVLISAFVIDPEDGSFKEGLQVELKFRITRTTTNVPICPKPVPTTPPPPTAPPMITTPPPKRRPNASAQQPTPAEKPQKPGNGGTHRPGHTPTRPSHEHHQPTTVSTTKGDVKEKPVPTSKKAGIAIAACLVSLGIICAVVMIVLHVVKGKMSKKPRPDTKGAQKGKKTTTSPA
ncbi:uncharacterized protein LOC119741722 [Patiria miniata]|uniref:Fibronectin type-III domain-containing protein n=1 Tax=Patiria miniata TaxID=46514 RepID=A0A914BBV8_PATMI|nr:uncharacterized protein LOC119741722 [Patiria miniata]